jgi:predicted phosphodiesterase
MRILVISDIHANLTAFEQILKDCEGEWEQIWFLGDLVGYGPDPNECAHLIREHDHVALSGNHDWAVLGKVDIESFNTDAQSAIRWTQQTLESDVQSYLDELPPMLPQETFTLAHGSPRHPVWEYVLDKGTAALNFDHFESDYCLVGHTHTPVIYEQIDHLRVAAHAPRYNQPITLDGGRLIINPGSVGQPRDADPRASYALLDTETLTWEYRRVVYDVEAVQRRMEEAGMPPRLVHRLSYGW